MSKTILHSILAAASLLMAVSCQKEDFSGKNAMPEGSIGFNAYTSTPTTKGTIIEKTDVQTQGIGVFAFYQAAVSGQPVPFSTRKFVTPDFMYNQQVAYNGSDWTYSPIKYWPNNENDWLSFFAYAPFKENRRWDSMGISTNSNSDKLNVTFEVNEDVNSQEDILWATPQINQSNKMENSVNNTSKKVSFNFKHITSKLDLMVGITTGSTADAWNDFNTEITLKSIVFNNLNSEFKYVYNINDSKLVEPATVDNCDGKTYDLTAEPNETVEKITESKWGIPSSPLHTSGIFTAEHVAKYGYYYAFLPTDQHLFLAPQVFTDQTVTITYVVKTTDPNNTQNGSTVTNSVTKKLASTFPFIGSSTTERGLESGKSYNIKFLISLDDVNISADVQSWDTDIFDHETYVPANYTVSTWQNGIYNPVGIVADQNLCINVRDITLNNTNSNFYRIKDYSATPYALHELTEQVLAEEFAKSKLTPSQSDLKFTKVEEANITYVTTQPTTPQTVFETTTMCVAAAGLADNDVYMFEYLDPSGLKSYLLVKVGENPTTTPALTMEVNSTDVPVQSNDTCFIDNARVFRIAVKEDGKKVVDLRTSSFKVEKGTPAQIVEDAFTITYNTVDSTYKFTPANITDSTVFTVSVNSSNADTHKHINVSTYSFSPATVSIMPNGSATTTVYLGTQKATGCTVANLSIEGATGITVTDVTTGVVTLTVSNDVTLTADAKLIGTKDGVKMAECAIKFASYPGTEGTAAANWPLAKIGGVWWAPVNCGYSATYKFGLLYQFGRYAGSGFGPLADGEPEQYLEEYQGTYKCIQQCVESESGGVKNDLFYIRDFANATEDWYTINNWQQFENWPQQSGDYKYIEGKIDNPCPAGWRVPTKDELLSLYNCMKSFVNAGGPDNLPGRYFGKEPNKLFLPAAGFKLYHTGKAYHRGYTGQYWSSTGRKLSYYEDYHWEAYGMLFWDDDERWDDMISRGQGMSVRCVLK